MNQESRMKLALLCGGRSAEREVSLAGADIVRNHLSPERYEVSVYDARDDIERLVRDAGKIDFVFILLHGPYGEDGTVQGLLELLDLPYQGSGVLGSALAMDKHLSKVVYKEAGIDTPQWMVLRRSDVSEGVISSAVQWLGFPMMVKPCTQGSSVGMTKARDRQELTQAIERAFEFDSRIMLEEFISGREITGGVLGNEDLTALPIVEIVPSEGYAFFDYEAKYKKGATKEICPAELPDELTLLAQDMALRAHRALNLSGYSRTDMLLSEKGRLYSIETNTIPGMTPTSLFPQAAAAHGIDFSQLLDRLIELGLERKGKRP